jgi:hypothetical protein
MGKTIMGVAAVSLDGFIADDNDDVGPLFDWLGSGDVGWSLPGSDDEARSSRASADFTTSHYANTATNVIGRRLFDLTNGWGGKPAAFEHVFVVTRGERRRALRIARDRRAGRPDRERDRRLPLLRGPTISSRQSSSARASRPPGWAVP